MTSCESERNLHVLAEKEDTWRPLEISCQKFPVPECNASIFCAELSQWVTYCQMVREEHQKRRHKIWQKKNETHWLLWKRVLLEKGTFGNGWIGKWLFGKGCSKKRMNWKRVLLEKGAFGNGCFWKWLNWKMVVWKRVLLEKGALGKGCFWKRVLLEMAELENGCLERGALGKRWIGKWCFWKMDFWKRVLLEHYEKKFTKLMSFGIN